MYKLLKQSFASIAVLLIFVSCSPKIMNTNVTRENYIRIQVNMTTQDVIDIMGDDHTVSETEASGIGRMQLWSYQLGMTAINVTFINGKVYDKGWIEL